MTSAPIRYYGSKWRLASWVISFFPPHETFVDVFGGAGNIILQKQPSKVEIYNDIDSSIHEFFKVMKCPDKVVELKRLLDLTPYSRDVFKEARQSAGTDVERALQILILSHFGHGSSGLRGRNTGFRSFYGDAIKTASQIRLWRDKAKAVDNVSERFKTVALENLDCLDLIERCNYRDVLLYLDPPYPKDVRSHTRNEYNHEMDEEGHRRLLDLITGLDAMVVLSGYPGSLYDELPWQSYTTQARTINASFRTEKIWVNDLAAANLETDLLELELFSQTN